MTLGEDGCIMLERSVNGEYSITQFLPFEREDVVHLQQLEVLEVRLGTAKLVVLLC